jgi:hypothetical protein
VIREIKIRAGETRSEAVELARWINMNARGWYSGDLHNHRDWREMPDLLVAEDFNLAPTFRQWILDSAPISQAPPGQTTSAVRVVDATHAYSVLARKSSAWATGRG